MWVLIKKHPLLSCLLAALLIRLIAVVFSCGYMANDDHFETVNVAYSAVQTGLLNEEGLLKWNAVPSPKIGRSPFYVLSLYSQMYFLKLMGISNLDTMLYFIRLIHALLSLLMIWFAYRYIYETTESREYSLLGAMILAFHFLMPYLSVRNLIEQVSADILVPAIYFAYRGCSRNDNRLLFWAGILGGLSSFQYRSGDYPDSICSLVSHKKSTTRLIIYCRWNCRHIIQRLFGSHFSGQFYAFQS
jgi:hypothetical protein